MWRRLRRLPARSSARPPHPVQEHAASQPQPIDVTDTSFAAVVLGSHLPVVVDCWAEWCEPCQTMSAFVDFLAAEYAGRLLVTALDVDENPETPAGYSVMGLPTLLFLQDGVEVDRQVGLLPYEMLKAKIDDWLQSSHPSQPVQQPTDT